MPLQVRKIKNKNLYSVKNTQTGQVHSYGTTKTKAESQKRLLEQIDNSRAGSRRSPPPFSTKSKKKNR